MDLLGLQEEFGEVHSPEYCDGCINTLHDIARSTLLPCDLTSYIYRIFIPFKEKCQALR